MTVRGQIQESYAAEVPRIAVSLAEASRLLSVGATAVFELISTGKLRSKKLGGRTVVLVEDLARFAKTLPDRPITRARTDESHVS